MRSKYKVSTLRLVGVISFCTFMITLSCQAATNSSWSQGNQASQGSQGSQGSWSGSDGSSYNRSSRGHSSSAELSPFSPGSHNIALDLGQVFLLGDLNRYADSLGTQVHYTYGVSDLLAFDSSFSYSQHSNGKYSTATLLSGIRLNLSWYDKIIPYIVAGLGFYRPSFQDSTVAPSTNSLGQTVNAPNVSAILFGLHAGPGVDLQLSQNMFFGAAATIHTMFSSTQSWANGTQFSAGGTFVSFFLHVGASF